MRKSLQPVLVPQYLRRFKCVGSACEDSCCIGWRVNIDQDTYRKYRRCRDPELAPLFKRGIGRNRSRPSLDNYGKIRMGPNGRCPFLSEEGLCRIQLRLGEDYLSDTCYIYPRTINLVNGVVEKSATISCPEAARLALLNPAPMEFDAFEEPSPARAPIKARLDTAAPSLAHRPQRYLWELRAFAIDLLQNRAYSLEDRLILLGMFCRKAQEYVEQEQVHDLPRLVASYTQLVADGSLQESLAAIPAQDTIQMQLLKEMADERFAMGISNRRYLECLREFLAGIEYTAKARVEEIGERYREAYENHYRPFAAAHGYVLENYLVNHVFKNLFPFDQPDIFQSYVMLVVHYALAKLHLIGMARFHRGLTPDLALKLVQSLARIVEHNAAYLRRVLDLLERNGYANLAWMTILVRN